MVWQSITEQIFYILQLIKNLLKIKKKVIIINIKTIHLFSGWSIFHTSAAICTTYYTIKALGRGTKSVAATFIFNMGYLMTGYYLTTTENYDIKWTMPQCVLTLRLIGLAFDLSDGSQQEVNIWNLIAMNT